MLKPIRLARERTLVKGRLWPGPGSLVSANDSPLPLQTGRTKGGRAPEGGGGPHVRRCPGRDGNGSSPRQTAPSRKMARRGAVRRGRMLCQSDRRSPGQRHQGGPFDATSLYMLLTRVLVVQSCGLRSRWILRFRTRTRSATHGSGLSGHACVDEALTSRVQPQHRLLLG